MQAVAEPATITCRKCGRESAADATRCGVCWTAFPRATEGVRLAAIDISIGQLMVLLVKLTIAALPILIVCGIIGTACNAITGK